jgi:hypothetical protein
MELVPFFEQPGKRYAQEVGALRGIGSPRGESQKTRPVVPDEARHTASDAEKGAGSGSVSAVSERTSLRRAMLRDPM